MPMTYSNFYNKITMCGGKILEARPNYFIVWENPEGTVIRADYFDANGEFEGRDILKRP
jgi:hypothetical protein